MPKWSPKHQLCWYRRRHFCVQLRSSVRKNLLHSSFTFFGLLEILLEVRFMGGREVAIRTFLVLWSCWWPWVVILGNLIMSKRTFLRVIFTLATNRWIPESDLYIRDKQVNKSRDYINQYKENVREMVQKPPLTENIASVQCAGKEEGWLIRLPRKVLMDLCPHLDCDAHRNHFLRGSIWVSTCAISSSTGRRHWAESCQLN